MVDTPMDAFWTRLGAGLDTEVSGCGCTAGAELADFGLAPGEANMDATAAMSRVLARYVELSLQGENLRQMMIGGAKIPCNVWMAYANARNDYLAKSQYIFDQLAARGVTVEQVIYSQGKPALDPNDPNKVRTAQVQAPLRPPAFVGINCPGLPNMAGANFAGDVGWQPMPIALGFLPVAAAGAIVAACTAATLGGCLVLVGAGAVILGIAGYAGYKIVQQVAIAVREYESSPSKTVAAYTACFQGLVKGGLSPTDAVKRCEGSQSSAQQYAKDRGAQDSGGIGFWAWIGIGAATLFVGGLFIRALRNRAGAAVRAISPLPVGEVGRARRGRRGRSNEPILIGDMYLHPRSR